jgi:Zn-dependent peptidase ImmA (M78 family)
MSTRLARMQAEKLIEQLRIKKPPVDVERIAQTLGLQITEADLGIGVSGLLVTNAKTAHIVIQEKDAKVRKRFTISHEIGHFYLRHQFESGEHVHVDKGNFISQRGPQAATGIDPKEIEANQFAACLLMPSKMVQERVASLGGSPLLDGEVSQLAEEFEVSDQAMTIRLTTLDLL